MISCVEGPTPHPRFVWPPSFISLPDGGPLTTHPASHSKPVRFHEVLAATHTAISVATTRKTVRGYLVDFPPPGPGQLSNSQCLFAPLATCHTVF